MNVQVGGSDRYHIPEGIVTSRDLEDPGPFEPIFSQSIQTGEVLVDRRAEVMPWAAKERRESVGSLNDARNLISREMLADFEAQGLSIAQVAARMDVPQWQIAHLRKEYGLTKNTAAPQPKEEPHRPTQEADNVAATSAPRAQAEAGWGLHIVDRGRYSGHDLYTILGGLAVFAQHQECEFEIRLEIRRVAR